MNISVQMGGEPWRDLFVSLIAGVLAAGTGWLISLDGDRRRLREQRRNAEEIALTIVSSDLARMASWCMAWLNPTAKPSWAGEERGPFAVYSTAYMDLPNVLLAQLDSIEARVFSISERVADIESRELKVLITVFYDSASHAVRQAKAMEERMRTAVGGPNERALAASTLLQCGERALALQPKVDGRLRVLMGARYGHTPVSDSSEV